jgi:hypothetical protein
MVLPRAGDRGSGTQITVIYIVILFCYKVFYATRRLSRDVMCPDN